MKAAFESPLREHYLFAALSDEAFARVAAHVTFLRRGEGSLLFQRGQPARHFHVVLEGEVRLVLQGREGSEQTLQVHGPGQSFGEALMFMQIPAYPVGALVHSAQATIAAIDNDAYRGCLYDNPSACLRMLGDLSARLHGLVSELELRTVESARGRVLRHLLDRIGPDVAGATVIRLDEAKQVVASRLGIQPETLSRVLRSLSEDGLIVVDGREIRVFDTARLRNSL